MQVASPDKIRNLAVVGHNDTGKTTLTSALLYTAGVTNRLHRVEDGNTITDFDPQEIERKISINLSIAFAPWREHKINLLDCPGYCIFVTETECGLRAADAALLCVSGAAGIEVMTERVWEIAAEMGLPVIFNLTKLDRERADFFRVAESLADRVRARRAAGADPDRPRARLRRASIDLVRQEAYRLPPRRQRQGREGRDPRRLPRTPSKSGAAS